MNQVRATDSPWVFKAPCVGYALKDGGYLWDHGIDALAPSPEFSFPLQLVYSNTMSQKGILGSYWSIPQLDSRILPQDKNWLWTRPDGTVLFFVPIAGEEEKWIDPSGQWVARKLSGDRMELRDLNGWIYLYHRSYPISIESPSQRALLFEWSLGKLLSVSIKDMIGQKTKELIRPEYDKNTGKLSSLQIGNRVHEFGFETIRNGLLNLWKKAEGGQEQFGYTDQGNLIEIVTTFSLPPPVKGEKRKAAEIKKREFELQFIPPLKNKLPDISSEAKKNPENYWLVSDGENKYSYDREKDADAKKFNEAGIVTFTDKFGLKSEFKLSRFRGVDTTTLPGGEVQQILYFQAPGQKYDKKLRRIQVGKKIVLENKYERSLGRLIESTDEREITTYYEYPELKVKRIDFQGLGVMKPIRILKGNKKEKTLLEEYRYDPEGRLLEKIDEYGKSTQMGYDKRGDLVEVKDSEGLVTSYRYDEWGRVLGVKQGKQENVVEYDDQDRLKSRVDSEGILTVYEYDAQSRIQKILRNKQLQVEYLYDEKSNVVGEKNNAGQLKELIRDEKGRILSEKLPSGIEVKYEYNEHNQKVAQIDGNGGKVKFSYDDFGRLVEQSNAVGQSIQWRFNKEGRLIEKENGVQKISYRYNDRGLLECLDYGNPGEIIHFEYDDKDRRVLERTPLIENRIHWDQFNRLMAWQSKRSDGAEQVLRFTYNSRGQRTSLVLADLIPEKKVEGRFAGVAAHYQGIYQQEWIYDPYARLSEIKVNGRGFLNFSYGQGGRVIEKRFANGMSTKIAYDDLGRLQSQKTEAPFLSSTLSLRYEWNDLDQLIRRTWNDEAERFVYGAGGEMLKVIQDQSDRSLDQKPSGPELESYLYDKAGNISEKKSQGVSTLFTYNEANQIKTISCSGSVLSSIYDAAGRLIKNNNQQGKSEGPMTTYGWLDRPTSLIRSDLTRIGFDYYPDGQIAAKGTLTSLEKMPEPKPIAIPAKVEPKKEKGMTIAEMVAGFKEYKTVKTISSIVGTGEQLQSSDQKVFVAEEIYTWDGLALIRKGKEIFVHEPHVSGGAVVGSYPIGASGEMSYYLNDMLGTTLATVKGDKIKIFPLTTFGEPKKISSQPRLPSVQPPDLNPQVKDSTP